MTTFGLTRFGLSLAGVLVVGLLVTTQDSRAQQAGPPPPLPPELMKLRAALDKYQDPYVVVHDGYFSSLGCVHFPTASGPGQVPYPAGGMGVHFLNGRLIGPQVDSLRPQVLIYEPHGDKLRLVAAEWFVPLATGVQGRPQLWGHPFTTGRG